MPYLRLKPIEAPWGDYGHILYHGMSMHQSRFEGNIRLERTGPEIFPITFPIDVVVTDDCRRALLASGLTGTTFRPVIKHRIVDLDWPTWDTTEDEPPELPSSGEPEGYILDRPHSPDLALAMPELWELIAGQKSSDIYYVPATRIVAVSNKAKTWFERHYGDYVTITEVA
jgi:hypothetical protein